MKLNFKKLGTGSPLVILHGLYGMSDNWLSIGKQLSEYFQVYLVDQRNHGNSPHAASQTYNDMAEDLLEFLNDNSIERATLLGHSMGGKTVMHFALKYPERVTRLIVADIAPKSYSSAHSEAPQAQLHLNIINGMLSVDFSKVKTRNDIANQLKDYVPDKRVIQFLLKNLKKDANNRFSWKLNVEALRDNLPHILKGIETGSSKADFPVLFLKGENSKYITENDYEQIRSIFPFAEIVTIFDAGHWLHAEQPEAFLNAIKEFIFD